MRNRDFHIPSGYGDNKIVLMVRDPWTLYAYWEIQKEEEDRVVGGIRRQGLAVSKNILRVYDITEVNGGLDSRAVFDFELKDWTNSWYVHVKEPGRRWKADIGILCATGEFFSLVRSNVVKTPSYSAPGEWLTSCVK